MGRRKLNDMGLTPPPEPEPEKALVIVDGNWNETGVKFPATGFEPFRFTDPATGQLYEKCGPGKYRAV